MSTEDRLRRASQEMDRVTSSLSAPPLGKVRSSARMRSVGVAVAAAVGAIVLVGGTVLALNPGGETTIAPAGQEETTSNPPITTTTVLETTTIAPTTVPETIEVPADTTIPPAADASCSGSTIEPSALALSSVTQPVAQTLNEIVKAARACDFETLAAVGGGNVHASFGGDEAADLWAYEDENGYEPMYWLLSVLDLPYGTVDLGDELMYVWPRAAAYDGGWDTMPEEYVEELRAIYSDDDFEGFRQFGGYIGYRVGITESGDWSFFVVGD